MFFVILELVAAVEIDKIAKGEWHIRYKDSPGMIPFTVEIHDKENGQMGGSIWRNLKIESEEFMSVDDFATLFDVNIVAEDSGEILIDKETIKFTITPLEKGFTCQFVANEEVTYEIVMESDKYGTGTWDGSEIIVEKRDPIKVSKPLFVLTRGRLTGLVIVVTIVEIWNWTRTRKTKKLEEERRKALAEKKKDDDAKEAEQERE